MVYAPAGPTVRPRGASATAGRSTGRFVLRAPRGGAGRQCETERTDQHPVHPRADPAHRPSPRLGAPAPGCRREAQQSADDPTVAQRRAAGPAPARTARLWF